MTSLDQTPPIVVDVIPQQLQAFVHLHDVTNIPCFTYVTNGLTAYEQQEISFTLRRVGNENCTNFPMIPIELFHNIYDRVRSGETFDFGGCTVFDRFELLGTQNMKAVIFTREQPGSEVQLSKDTLHAVLITDEEYQVYKRHGILRMLSKIGYKERSFPFPSWNDRFRQNAVTMADLETSIILKTFLNRISGTRVTKMKTEDQINDLILMQVSPNSHEIVKDLVARMDSPRPFTILTELDDDADSCLIWKSGLTQPTTLSVHNTTIRTAGCFILFCPEQFENELKMVEDGYTLMLTNATYHQLCEAISSRKPFSVPLKENGQFRLEWQPMYSDKKDDPKRRTDPKDDDNGLNPLEYLICVKLLEQLIGICF